MKVYHFIFSVGIFVPAYIMCLTEVTQFNRSKNLFKVTVWEVSPSVYSSNNLGVYILLRERITKFHCILPSDLSYVHFIKSFYLLSFSGTVPSHPQLNSCNVCYNTKWFSTWVILSASVFLGLFYFSHHFPEIIFFILFRSAPILNLY